MQFLVESFAHAVVLLATFDREVYFTVWTSLWISGVATLIASVAAVPAGTWIAVSRFRGRTFVLLVLNTLMAMPTVVVGLLSYGLMSRRGPLGGLGLLFTPWGIVAGEVLLAFPLVTNLAVSAAQALDPRVVLTCRTLGASALQQLQIVLREARYGIMAAVVAGFGRVIGEVGLAMMIGGNIRGFTRTMTTAIALETSKGDFELALALGMVLLLAAFGLNAVLYRLQRTER